MRILRNYLTYWGKLFIISMLVLMFPLTGLVASGQEEGAAKEGEKTVVTIWNWSQEQQEFFNEMSARFEAENPDIDIQWTTYIESQFRDSLPLALRAGSGPDIFWTVPDEELTSFIQQGWIQPIEESIDADFLKQFNPSVMVEGAMYFNGKLYTLPYYNRFASLNGLMFYNKDVLKMAGLDPETSVPKTYSELREITKKVTEAGKGKFYGITWSGNPGQELHRINNGLLATGAPSSGDIRYGHPGYDYRTGQFTAASEGHQEVYNLLKAMVDDGSVTPGWTSSDKSTTRALFGQNKVAFYFDGEWMKGVWDGMGFENLDFGVAEAPIPDSGRRTYRQMSVAHGDVVVSAFTKDYEATMRVYKWLHSTEYQSELLTRGFAFPGNMNVDYDSIIQDEFRKKVLHFAEDTIIHPDPKLRNPETAKVAWPDVHPNINEIMVSALASGEDYLKLAKQLDTEMKRQLERNIERAKSEGADVSMEDFIFPDWDPMKDYQY